MRYGGGVNYRHSFHAGNFADLIKHAALLRALAAMQAAFPALQVVDTHGGAGRYALRPADLQAGEAAATRRLLADPALPPGLDELRQALQAENRAGEVVYPGSPLLVARRLRPRDSLLACELRPEEHNTLRETLQPFAPRAAALLADGYARLPEALRAGPTPALVLIDPPYERADDYRRVVQACAEALAVQPAAAFLIWAPLKDLETFDALLRSLEAEVSAPGLALEIRLRPLTDPMRMNGCALIALNAPAGLASDLEAAGAWIVHALGGQGGRAILHGASGPGASSLAGAQTPRKR